VHTADFKLDPGPLDGTGTDLGRIARIGEEGVLALLSDSTNAERPGVTPGERTVVPHLDALFRRAERRIFVTTFASNVERVQQVVNLAVAHGRKLALVGSSMIAHAEVAERSGLLKIPAGTRVPGDVAMNAPPSSALFLVTGSQGEPMSALVRIAVDRHKEVALEEGDLVVHSARSIPGNEKSIDRMINHALRRGADVVTEADAPIHVSGHPARDELRNLLSLLRPRFLLPIHGEYRQLLAHSRLAADSGLDRGRIVLGESGDVVALSESECEVVDRVQVGRVFIDASLGEVDLSVLRDRRKIAGDGIVIPIVAVERGRGAGRGTIEIVSRGFVPEEEEIAILDEARDMAGRVLEEASPEERADETLLKVKLQTELKRFLRRRTQRRPLIIPVIVEL
jgi:ribonuclease J